MLKKVWFLGLVLFMSNLYGEDIKEKCKNNLQFCIDKRDELIANDKTNDSLVYLNALVELKEPQSFLILGLINFKDKKDYLELFKEGLQLSKNKPEDFFKVSRFLLKMEHYKDAFKILELGYKENDSNSILMLAQMYSTDIFGQKNIEKAIELLNYNFKTNKSLESKYTLALIFFENKEYSKAIKEAEEFYSLNKENVNNTFLLSYLYSKIPLYTNNDKAINLLKTCKDKYHKCATNLGEFYYHGINVPQNYTLAKELFEKALSLNKDDPDALNNLGLLYSNGYGVEKDYEKAIEYWVDAIKLGNQYGYGNYMKLCKDLNKEGVEIEYCK